MVALANHGHRLVFNPRRFHQSSREGLLEDNFWNQQIQNQIPKAFLAAIEIFIVTTFIRYIPCLSDLYYDNFFKPVAEELQYMLKYAMIIRTIQRSEALILYSNFKTNGVPLISEEELRSQRNTTSMIIMI